MDMIIPQHTYAIVSVFFLVILALLAVRGKRYGVAATFIAIPVVYFSLQELGLNALSPEIKVPWPLALLSVLAFSGGAVSLWNNQNCDHEWICTKRHQGHDIGHNVYQCKLCGEIDNRIE